MSQILYDLPEGWEWKRLGDVVEFKNGFAFKSNDFSDTGIPVLRISNIQDGAIVEDRLVFYPELLMSVDLNRYFVEYGDIVIAMSGATTGKVAINKSGKIWLQNQRVGRFVIECDALKMYVYYFLNSVVKENLNRALGAAQPNLSTSQINEIEIPLPPLAEQTRIVEKLDAVLSRIDTAIDELQQSLALVDAMFKSGLDKAFNPLGSPTNEAGLYDLPDGWEWKTVDELCTKITDGTHSTPTYTDSGVPFLSVKDITKGFIDFSNTKFITEEEHKNLFKRCNPEFNDILYTKVGTTGIAKVIDVNDEFSLFVSVALLKPRKEIIESKFFEYILNSPLCYSQACAKTRGVANRNLVLKDIKSICVVVPSLEAQQQVVEALDALNDKTTQLKTELTAKIGMFNQLKASVLDGAFKRSKL